MFVLRKTEKGNYFVAKSGRAKSYTNSLKCAQKFKTKEEAEASRCIENEYIQEINLY